MAWCLVPLSFCKNTCVKELAQTIRKVIWPTLYDYICPFYADLTPTISFSKAQSCNYMYRFPQSPMHILEIAHSSSWSLKPKYIAIQAISCFFACLLVREVRHVQGSPYPEMENWRKKFGGKKCRQFFGEIELDVTILCQLWGLCCILFLRKSHCVTGLAVYIHVHCGIETM